ncbi:uncharacterized protein LOC123538439 [Mercenaria mercenaria]|uniref:uncharacterized protein LOC123538439 n=1 Tax=Mercenaria mercenaria TaxID=6596 RepID=UPI001E1DA7CD|nr:uncharacterized protein LOC123538439 [Mercenaria mercenaria]XP_045178481.1 uncharacterized protein LOC123538439 [Mercenaria mercenaria]
MQANHNRSSVESSYKCKHFLNRMLKCRSKWTTAKEMVSCKVAGRLLPVSPDECWEGLLQSTNSTSALDLKKCFRVEINGQKYFSQAYQRMKKRTCYFVVCHSGEVVSVKFFVVNKEKKVFAVVKVYEIPDDCYILRSSGRHIFKVVSTECLKTIHVSEIMDKLFYIAIDNAVYVVCMPNILGRIVFK